jgi:hypothetical protein
MITVVNKHKHKGTQFDFYIGRGSPLGNPWTHLSSRMTLAKYQATSRDDAIAKYTIWLTLELREPHSAAAREFNRILKIAQSHDVWLVCYCKPRPCHGDIIKKLMENLLFDGNIRTV